MARFKWIYYHHRGRHYEMACPPVFARVWKWLEANGSSLTASRKLDANQTRQSSSSQTTMRRA